MAEIKFRCPECTQKIAVEASAVGVKIDCPTCHSGLVIPQSDKVPVEVLTKRKLAILGGSADAMYADLQKAQTEAAKATEELKQLREKHTATVQGAKKDIEGLIAAQKSLEGEVAALRPLRDELAAAKKSLAEAAEREARRKAATAEATALRTELTGLQAMHAETENRLATITEQLGALQRERDEIAKKTAAEAAELRRQFADTRSETERAQADARTAAEAHRVELAEAEAQCVQAEARLPDLAAKLTSLEAERTQLTGIVEELLPLREELAQAQRNICALSESAAEKARGHESELQAARASAAELRGLLGDLQAQHAAAQDQLSEHGTQVETAVRRVAELQSEAATAKSLREQLTAAQGEAERLRKEAEQAAKEREAAAQKHEAMLAEARATEKTLQEYADRLHAKFVEAERRHAAVNAGFTGLKEESADLTGQLAALRKERDDAATAAAAKEKTIAELRPAISSAQAEITRLRDAEDAAAADRARISAALEKAMADRAEIADGKKQRDALMAAKDGEIAQFKQLAASTENAAKNRETQFQLLSARVESLTGLVLQHEAAVRETQAEVAKERTERIAAQERAKAAERAAADSAERAKKIEAEKSAELETLRNETARAKSALDQLRTQGRDTQPASAGPTEREKTLETERDALTAALDRAKQHVGVLQARRDMLRDEVATLRSRLGVGKVTSADEKPVAS